LVGLEWLGVGGVVWSGLDVLEWTHRNDIYYFYQRFFKVIGLEWGLTNAEFQALSIHNVFELNGCWSGLEWVGAYFINTPGFEFGLCV
jgi:hypothetical protein